MIYLNIDKNDIDNIGLIELALFANTGKIGVVCDKCYSMVKTVRAICKKYGLKFKYNKHDNWIIY